MTKARFWGRPMWSQVRAAISIWQGSCQCNVVPTFSALYRQNDDAPDASNKKISDHLPLWAEFKVNELTQELNAAVKRM